VGVYNEGFIHAGNFAYLSLVTLFAFCIVAAAIAGSFGQTASGLALIDAFFRTVPPSAAEALSGPVHAAMTARSGPLLWLSALVSLWTTSSLIETIRDVTLPLMRPALLSGALLAFSGSLAMYGPPHMLRLNVLTI
jgi:membrane protein